MQIRDQCHKYINSAGYKIISYNLKLVWRFQQTVSVSPSWACRSDKTKAKWSRTLAPVSHCSLKTNSHFHRWSMINMILNICRQCIVIRGSRQRWTTRTIPRPPGGKIHRTLSHLNPPSSPRKLSKIWPYYVRPGMLPVGLGWLSAALFVNNLVDTLNEKGGMSATYHNSIELRPYSSSIADTMFS